MGRPQFVRLESCASESLISNIAPPPMTLYCLPPFSPPTLQIISAAPSYLQIISDDTVIVGCVDSGWEDTYKDLVHHFVTWCGENHLQLNVTKTKETVVDFSKNKFPPSPVCNCATDVEMMTSYMYLGRLQEGPEPVSSRTVVAFIFLILLGGATRCPWSRCKINTLVFFLTDPSFL